MKVYNALVLNRIEPGIEEILWKNQYSFQRIWSTSQILTLCRIIEGVGAKILDKTPLFEDFSRALDSIHRRKMEQILLMYGLLEEIVTAINTKVKVRSPDRDTDFFDIVAGVLQGDTLAPFIICQDSPWCNGYRRRIWTRRHEFKSWTWLIAFHIALIPLGKVWTKYSPSSYG